MSAEVIAVEICRYEREVEVVNAEIVVGASVSDPDPDTVVVAAVAVVVDVVIDNEGDVDGGRRDPAAADEAGDCAGGTETGRDCLCPKRDAKGIEIRDGAWDVATRGFGRGGRGGFGGFGGIGRDATYSSTVNVGYDDSGG